MGKKLNQASTKICKADRKQLNSLINVLKPKVYITDPSNFKSLVQELTGNGNPISFNPPPIHQEPAIQEPIIDIEDQGYRERSSDSSVDSSEASLPISFAAAAESSPEAYASETFNVLESSFADATSIKNIDFPPYGDFESWLLAIDNYSYDYDAVGDYIPALHQGVSLCGFDFPELI